MTLFRKILIANRGEIACRIMRTAKRLGISTVAVFSEADKNAMHVKLADEAYLLGPAPSSESYLNTAKIIAIAKACEANAIHPGYGFLSENPAFASACEQAGMIFIGPSADAIALMANKNVAKEKMAEHDIPILPGFYDQSQSLTAFRKHATKIGYPILLKAAAGGGGKGLRLVQEEQELEHAFYAVKREAKAYFNDEQILLEKYLANTRHIEVQIIADSFGNVQHLLTRDCSIQRRHQKIVEEAPAPNIPRELQDKMTATAIKIAEVINYTNAGTIEFLLENDQFYFMEMNTRLQVEHPVTEMITNLDLVEWQIRIAAGEHLFQDAPSFEGHAIEVRLNAEDPDRDFLPSAGKLALLNVPQNFHDVRVDCGYQTNDEINIYYDSLIAKIIVWAKSREQAINKLNIELNNVEIFGVKTNLALLKEIISNAVFKNAQFNTLFLNQTFNKSKQDIPTEIFCLVSIYLSIKQEGESSRENDPWNKHDGWRLLKGSVVNFSLTQHNSLIEVKRLQEKFQIKFDNQTYHCQLLEYQNTNLPIIELGLLISNQQHQAKIFQDKNKIEVIYNNENYALDLVSSTSSQSLHEVDELLIAPMPGTLVAQLVKTGQDVTKGDKLIVIEAMKMEHTLFAPRDGRIKQTHYKIGDLVKEGAELLEFE